MNVSEPRFSTRVTSTGIAPSTSWSTIVSDSGRKPTVMWFLSSGVRDWMVWRVSGTLAWPSLA